MAHKTLLMVLAGLGIWMASAADAQAQRPRSVSRPSLNSSPYSYLIQRELGRDPYSIMRSYLQPNQQRTRRDVTATPNAGGTNTQPGMEVLRARAQKQQPGQTSVIAPTGTHSTFMHTSHFYTMPRYSR